MKKTFLSLVASATLLISCNERKTTPVAATYPEGVEHYIVIGIDGMNAEGLEASVTPNMDKLIAGGAYSDRARVVFPISSSPNWATLLSGVGTEMHAVISNSWMMDDTTAYQPLCKNEQNRFPTIFSVVRAQMPDAEIGAIYDWKDFDRLFERSLVDKDYTVSPERETTKAIVDYIKSDKPTFLFTQLDRVDGQGHTYGWMSEGYFKAIQAVDSLVGDIVGAVEEAGIMDNTVIMVVADHGGFNKTHGSTTDAQELAVPIILYGKGVKKGYTMRSSVYTMDCAPTIAFALGVKEFSGWRGKPIAEAFEGFEAPEDVVKVNYLKKEEF